jgi:hypothetical protein
MVPGKDDDAQDFAGVGGGLGRQSMHSVAAAVDKSSMFVEVAGLDEECSACTTAPPTTPSNPRLRAAHAVHHCRP